MIEVTLLLVELEIKMAPLGTGSTQYLWQGYLWKVYLISNFEKPWRS